MRYRIALSCLLACAASPAVANDVLLPPTPIQTAHPVYPESEVALQRHVDVVLSVVIEADGSVAAISITASGGTAFDEAAVKAMKQWRFEPATKNGQPIAVEIPVPVHFEPPRLPAPTATAPSHTDAPTPHDAGQTHVTAQKVTPPVATGDIHIDVGQLRLVPRSSAAELLNLAPGVVLTNHGGEGHPDTIFLRGFDAGEGQDIELSIDGVPLNDVSSAAGHGFADLNIVPMELVHSLHVVEGPFDPRQGDFGVAGSAEFHLDAQPGLTLKGGFGSFMSARAFASYKPSGDDKHTFVAGFAKRSDGFFSNRASSGGGVVLSFEHQLLDNTSVRALAILYAARFDQAGVVRAVDVKSNAMPCSDNADAQFFCAYSDNQGGTLMRGVASVEATTELPDVSLHQQAFAIVRSTRLRENFTGFLLDTQSPQRGDAVELSDAATTVGVRARARRHFAWLNHRQDVEAGVYGRHDIGDEQALRLRSEDTAPYRTVFAHNMHVTNLAAYASLRFVPVSFWALSGGVRADGFMFQNTDLARPVLDRQGERLPEQAIDSVGGLLQPRVSSLLKLTDGLQWQTSLGVGSRSSDSAALSQGELAPFALVTASETGLHYRLVDEDAFDFSFWRGGAFALDLRGGAFSTEVSRDLVFDEATGRNVDIGRSWRAGAYGFSRVSVGETLSWQLSGAYTEAYTVEANQSALDVVGSKQRLPYVPRLMGRSDISVMHRVTLWGQELRGDVNLGTTVIGPRPLPLSQFSDPIVLVDTSAHLGVGMFDLGLEVKNLLDARYQAATFHYASNFRGADAAPSRVTTNHFVAGAPRMLLGTLTCHFDI